MQTHSCRPLVAALMVSAVVGLLSFSRAAGAQDRAYDIPAESLSQALRDYGRESGRQIVFTEDLVRGHTSLGVKGTYSADAALAMLLNGTGLVARSRPSGAIMIERKSAAVSRKAGRTQVPQLTDSARPASFGSAGGELEQIVVTAQKVSENPQQIPLSISAYSAADLERLQVFSMQSVKYLSPNLYLEGNLANVGTPKIFMRGIGQANDAFSFSSPIGIYVDGVYYPQDVGSLVDFLDVSRIEVLRGPQGTIFGRNNSVGAIRVITQDPPLDQPDAVADVTVGTEDQHDERFDVGLPLVQDKLGLRFAFNSQYNEGFEVDTTNGDRADSENSNAGRAALLWKASDTLSITFRGDFLQDNSRPPVGTNFLNNDLSCLCDQSELSYSQGTARSRLETFGSSITVNWDLGNEKLTSITAWRGVNTINGFDFDGEPVASLEFPHSDLTDRSVTQEVFLTGPRLGTLPIEWVAGVFYFHEQTAYLYSEKVFTPPSLQNFMQHVSSEAGYLQGTYHLTDALAATAGARYTAESKDFGVISHLADGSFDFAYYNDDLVTSRVTWRGALNYQVSQPLMLYASAATGFQSGGLNGNATTLASVTTGSFATEDTQMYEGGLKSEWLDSRLRLNADYFYGIYRNVQQPLILANGEVSNVSPTAHVNGVELQADLVPFPGMRLSVNGGTLNNTILDSTTKLPNAPRLTLNLAATYSHTAGRLGTASGTVAWSYEDSSYEDAANTPALEVAAHDNLDANISLLAPDDHWIFTLAGHNLTNRIYEIGGFDIANGFIAATKWPSLPRRVEFTVRYKY